jgi:hypothetical protein
MDDYSFDREMQPEKRNTFLTVLCILTFIGSGWGIIGSVIAYKAAGKTTQIFSDSSRLHKDSLGTTGTIVVKDSVTITEKDSVITKDSVMKIESKDSLKEKRVGTPMEKKMIGSLKKMLTKENIEHKAIGDLLSALFTLLGALLMWRLRKVGFHLYVAGVIISIAIPFYLYGNDFVAVGMSMVGPFFGLVFIALYALNYKSLKNH